MRQPSRVDVRQTAIHEGPSIFSAQPEQHVLRLESAKAAVEFRIVEHAERPTEN
jgi:uncharacterized protein (TIGR03435 family)